MNEPTGVFEGEDPTSVDPSESEEGNPRLDRWINRTTLPLDLFALGTIWLTIIPFGDIHNLTSSPIIWIIGRLFVSFVYGIDMAIRTYLSHRRWHYFTHHPIGVLAIVLPAIRLIFSLRLLRAMFKKGNTLHFLFVSLVLLLNLMVIVWGFERSAPGSNITTIGIAMWWGCVTVFTVGYGDYYPITTQGRIAAVAIMVLGLTTAAVITAQIASSFMDQAQARRNEAAQAGGTASGSTVVETDSSADRLRRIEELLRTRLEPNSDSSDQT